MKKLFFFSFFLISCSSENSVYEASEKVLNSSRLSAKPTINDFEIIYAKMVNSKEYLTCDAARSSFMSKLNCKGDDSVFNDEVWNR